MDVFAQQDLAIRLLRFGRNRGFDRHRRRPHR